MNDMNQRGVKRRRGRMKRSDRLSQVSQTVRLQGQSTAYTVAKQLSISARYAHDLLVELEQVGTLTVIYTVHRSNAFKAVYQHPDFDPSQLGTWSDPEVCEDAS